MNVWSADERDIAEGLVEFISTNTAEAGVLTREVIDDFFEASWRLMGVFWSEQFELGPERMFA